MDIGVALPTMIPDRSGGRLLEWAVQAEQQGYSCLAVLDRLVYANDEPLTTLAAAAAVTDRIRLATAILIAPYRGNTALLAKQAATVQHLSDGRLTLGVAAGARPDDYKASGTAFGDRGRRLDGILRELQDIWADGEIGPTTVRPEILVGGRASAALRRAAAYGDGYLGAAGPPETFAERAEEVQRLWSAAGREGRPRLVAQTYACLGPSAQEEVREHLGDYYSFAGPLAERMIGTALTSEQDLADAAAGYAKAGCDELIIIPCSADPGQLALFGDAIEVAR